VKSARKVHPEGKVGKREKRNKLRRGNKNEENI
jgi:hypothetical protein